MGKTYRGKDKAVSKVAAVKRKNARKSKVGKSCAAIVAAFALAMAAGCRSFYEHAGAAVRMGSVIAPIEISDPTSSVKCRALYAMDGIDFYAAKNCVARMEYANIYTNSYFGIVECVGSQRGSIEIQPTEDDASGCPDGSCSE